MNPRTFGFVTHLFVIIFNPWWWFILQKNYWIGLLIFVLSFSIFHYFYLIKSSFYLKILLGLTGILIFICIKEGFDAAIFSNSVLEVQQYNKRHEFYAADIGKIYTNRFSLLFFKNYSLPLYKLQRNLFSNLDPNLYFFKSHPRERGGIDEFDKYLPVFLPVFLIGILYCIFVLFTRILIYFLPILIISSAISPSFYLGPILYFPIINLIITVGIILSLEILLKFSKRGYKIDAF